MMQESEITQLARQLRAQIDQSAADAVEDICEERLRSEEWQHRRWDRHREETAALEREYERVMKTLADIEMLKPKSGVQVVQLQNAPEKSE